MDLSGKVVFITGAAQGLGKAYAESLLQLGAKVALGDVNAALGAATSEELQRRFGEESVIFYAFDVTDHQQFRDAFNAAVSHFGHIDVLVNNAGIMDESKWELMIQINYTSLVFGTRLAIEHMRKDTGGLGGRIINISSMAGLEDYYFIPVYCGTKHAVRAYTSSLAQQPNIEEQGIEFGVLCPDAAATELVSKIDENRILFFDEAQPRFEKSKMDVETVVDAFLELAQLEQMNGAILLVSLEGKTYRKMESLVYV
ncbi:unnamed protein product [Candidula unifasciata]|uniref:15-hydroxyprostaglandin dehydrogenase [NAD(+)] n=1 Tax=Candidula unifasciata TaxID=100452 RepID=A0A8S3YH01_9EUPU|nr:unnamed protein product [Candidula unifasciata]